MSDRQWQALEIGATYALLPVRKTFAARTDGAGSVVPESEELIGRLIHKSSVTLTLADEQTFSVQAHEVRTAHKIRGAR
ncbi:hypothetical protein DTO57_11460 [Microbacterium sorbitolivorans]|uniref:Uncharacterized protein n=1 Tax=Microbacterium sorbitolivorans TaxID=1867410 RepID=A0A367XTJ0_9MICO|nr:hypothetical protein DTO57_11460 [Microbacterium sorbitolivorans]